MIPNMSRHRGGLQFLTDPSSVVNALGHPATTTSHDQTRPNQAPARLLFLFSPGMSIQKWDEVGFLSRELRLAAALAARLGEVWWYTYGARDNDYAATLRRHDVQLFPAAVVTGSQHLPHWVHDWRRVHQHLALLRSFHVVKTNQFPAWRLAAMIRRATGLPFLLRRGVWHPLRYRIQTRRPWAALREFAEECHAYGLANSIAVTSAAARDFIESLLLDPAPPVRILPNAVDTNHFLPAASVRGDGKELRLVYVGRLSHAKDPGLLFRALRNLTVPATLTVIGRGRLRARLERRARKLPFSVTFVDRVPNESLPSILNQHDVFILPSRWEGNPKALLEAMSCALPVIVRNSFGIRDIVRHERTGLLFENADELCHSLERLARADPARRRELGAEGRAHILRNNNLTTLASLEAQLLNDLALRCGPR